MKFPNSGYKRTQIFNLGAQFESDSIGLGALSENVSAPANGSVEFRILVHSPYAKSQCLNTEVIVS
jgi:hypothetical protein